MHNLSIGFTLMLVGMVTVFAILLIVIYGSRLLILLVNRIAPEEEHLEQKPPQPAADASIDAVLEAAVAQITAGRGHIVKITKL